MIGRTLGPYQILAELGRGGMGEVYRAYDARLGREVALKVLPAASASSPEAEARFTREARAAAALNHPNICTIFDVGTADGRRFIVMELLAGETMHQVVARGPLATTTFLDMATALADAVAAAHSRRIVHRDLKPANVFVTTGGVVKILDFGLAKALDDSESSATASTNELTQLADAPVTNPGTAIGTLSYMSPEQLRGGTADARSDLFSLGLVFYEMATGQRAFAGRTNAEVSAAVLHVEPAPPRRLRQDLPEKLDEIIVKLLEKDPELRYQSAAELRADLKRLRRSSDSHEPAAAAAHQTRTSPVLLRTAAVSRPAPTSSDASLAAGLARRHPLVIAAAVLIPIIAVAAAWWALGGRTEPPAELTAADLSMAPLTVDGHASVPTISPDGKFIAYIRSDGVHESVVVKQLGSNSDVVVMPPDDAVSYTAPSVTPDGNYVDVAVARRDSPEIYIARVPFLGGAIRKIANASSGLGWSPEGRQMAFVRFDAATQATSLVVADAEGRNERTVATRRNPSVFIHTSMRQRRASARPAWSPDGRSIAVGGMNFAAGVFHFDIIEIDVATGTERVIGTYEHLIYEVAYLDQHRVVASVAMPHVVDRWLLFPRTGPARPLTPELNDIRHIQLTADRASGVALRSSRRSSITVGAATGASLVEAVAESTARPSQAALDGRGNLYYMMREPGGWAAFRQEAGRGAPVRLSGRLFSPIPSIDGRFVVGIDEPGHLVQLNLDSGDPTIVLKNPVGGPLALVDNDTAVLFVSSRQEIQRPWLMPLAGGEPRQLADVWLAVSRAWVSADGRQVIYQSSKVELCAFPGFTSCREIKVAAGPFAADGKSVFAINPADPKNIISQPIDGGAPIPVTRFTDKVIRDFQLSPDRTRIAITREVTESDVVLIKGLKKQ